ncbi:MAG: antibiotic biosynthesis monooxygenase [Actinomycetota bacterium]|nr:antibiotic biosynthesis monooxygenase [Actinomycetota bacterium]
MNDAGPRDDRADVQGAGDLVTFIQIWEVADAAAQQAWLAVMHDHIDLLRAKPGFITMTLHPSIDGKRIAVYAQWASGAALDHAISDPAAIAAHDQMAQIGTSDGTLYTLDRRYGPITPASP